MQHACLPEVLIGNNMTDCTLTNDLLGEHKLFSMTDCHTQVLVLHTLFQYKYLKFQMLFEQSHMGIFFVGGENVCHIIHEFSYSFTIAAQKKILFCAANFT